MGDLLEGKSPKLRSYALTRKGEGQKIEDFLLFLALSEIANQMTVTSLVGFIGNLLGALCFHLARRINREAKE